MTHDRSQWPDNAVYIKQMKLSQLPEHIQKEVQSVESEMFVVFNRDGVPITIAETRLGAMSSAMQNEAEIFALH